MAPAMQPEVNATAGLVDFFDMLEQMQATGVDVKR
jgi:hypothetical protein